MAMASGLGGGAAAAGGLLAYSLANNQNYDQLSVDPNLAASRDQLNQQAQSFQSNLPGYQAQLYTQQENNARNQMAQKLNDVKTSANQRGLLYSGLKQGQEAQVGGQTATGLANTRANINTGTQNMSNQMNQNATQFGLGVQQQQQQMNDYNYQQQLGQQQQKQAAAQGFLGGVGKMVGAAAG